MRPLDRLDSIKVKLGVVIVATVIGTVAVLALGLEVGPLARAAGRCWPQCSASRWCSSSPAA